MPYLLYFGHVNIDTILRVRDLPERGESREVVEIKERTGGTAYNTYKSLRALGVPAHIFTVVGKDFREELEGIIIRGEITPRCWIVTDGREQTAFVYQGLWKKKDALNIPRERLRDYEILHFSTGNPHFYLKVAREAKKMGIKIGFDPSQEIHYIYNQEIFRELLELADYFFCNENEYEKAEKWADDILKKKTVIRTEGEDGASLYLPERGWSHYPAEEVRVEDTTGAGDSFRAGFYAALYRGKSLEECVKYGNKVAGKVVSSSISYYIGTWEEI